MTQADVLYAVIDAPRIRPEDSGVDEVLGASPLGHDRFDRCRDTAARTVTRSGVAGMGHGAAVGRRWRGPEPSLPRDQDRQERDC